VTRETAFIPGEKCSGDEGSNERVDKKIKRVVGEKMQMELQFADIVDEHNIKAQATRLKMTNIKTRCYCYPTCIKI
jgi:hypothetical protein